MITRVRGGAEVELRSFALSDLARYGWGDVRGVSGAFGEKQMRGIPAIQRAARLRAEAVASLRLCCYSGEGPDRVRRENVWQDKLFSSRPNEQQTRFGFWDAVEESMSYRNNAFIWKNTSPDYGRILEWYALHPDQVQPQPDGSFKVDVDSGYVDPVGRGPGRYTVGRDTILHIRGFGDGGSLVAPSLIQYFRLALQGPFGRMQHEARMWRRGATLQVGIEFPQGVTTDQANEWRDSFQARYQGTDGDTAIVSGGGAVIKPIGMTQADAQFAEMANLTVKDASLIMSVPANLLGHQLERSVPNLEQDLASWLRFGLSPELFRIECALAEDEQLFPPGSQTRPEFDTQDFVRGDLVSEATILVQLVQAGILTPDEARHTRGLDDLPDGVGATPQITPVGGAPNPVPMVPAASSNGDGGEY